MDITSIKGLEFSGGKFEKKTKFEFWPNESHICLLYGRNGAGKSTIARAINNIADKYRDSSIKHAKFYSSEEISISDVDYDCIHVYNEDFCADKALFPDGEGNAKVLLGEQPRLQKEIEQKKREQDNILVLGNYANVVVRKLANTGVKRAQKLITEEEEIQRLREEHKRSDERAKQIRNKQLQHLKEEAKHSYEKAEQVKKEFALLARQLAGDITQGISDFTESNENLKASIEDLRAKQREVSVPFDEINKDLRCIFYSADAVQLTPKDGYFEIISHGKPVKMRNLSRGEKNAITLCYFFASCNDSENSASNTNKPQLFVLDDPISSFDSDNKIGVLSFLHSKIIELSDLGKNKFLFLSHDLTSYMELVRSLKNGVSAKKFLCKLEKQKLEPVKKQNIEKDFYEYTDMLINIYDFACKSNDDYNYYIGNAMRRVLEAYGTFLFKCGIWDHQPNEDFWKLFGNNDVVEHLKHFLFRILLNGGSHSGDALKAGINTGLGDTVSYEEKLRTARGVICFLHATCPIHLRCHLEYRHRTEEDHNKPWDWRIKQWEDEIKGIETGEKSREQNSQK